MKNLIIYLVFAVIMLSCTSVYKSHYDKPQPVSDKEWIVIGYVDPEDSLNILEVTYSPELPKNNENMTYKFKPETDTIQCRVAFYNKSLNSYRLIAPQFNNSGLQLDNLTNVQIKKVPIKK